jgi:ABC-type iron transport system FetAB ATPase subunit
MTDTALRTTATVSRQVAQAWADYEGQAGQARMLLAELKRAKDEAAALEARIEYLGKIAAFLNAYADDRQAVVQSQIENIVSKGLRQIFAEDLTLRLVNRQVGRRPELDFVLVSQIGSETLETSILDARGGGVAAVAGFLIQAVLVLLTPGLRPIVFLDEVFAQVSSEYEEPLADFIAELVHRSELQVVLVTHSTAYSQAADRQYRFAQIQGVTEVEEMKVGP